MPSTIRSAISTRPDWSETSQSTDIGVLSLRRDLGPYDHALVAQILRAADVDHPAQFVRRALDPTKVLGIGRRQIAREDPGELRPLGLRHVAPVPSCREPGDLRDRGAPLDDLQQTRGRLGRRGIVDDKLQDVVDRRIDMLPRRRRVESIRGAGGQREGKAPGEGGMPPPRRPARNRACRSSHRLTPSSCPVTLLRLGNFLPLCKAAGNEIGAGGLGACPIPAEIVRPHLLRQIISVLLHQPCRPGMRPSSHVRPISTRFSGSHSKSVPRR